MPPRNLHLLYSFLYDMIEKDRGLRPLSSPPLPFTLARLLTAGRFLFLRLLLIFRAHSYLNEHQDCCYEPFDIAFFDVHFHPPFLYSL